MEDDLSLRIRRCKRSRATKFELSNSGLNSLPTDIYGLTDLEVLDVSNNKLASIDTKISQLTKLKFLDISNNQIISLPQSIANLPELQVLNVSGNPLGPQFDALLKKENQSEPNLKSVLKTCLSGGSFGSTNSFGTTGGFGSVNEVEEIFSRPGTSMGKTDKGLGLSGISKPNWLDDDGKNLVKNLDSSDLNDTNLKKQLSNTESLLAKEQQKIIELTRELEKLRSNQQELTRYGGFGLKAKNEFGLNDEIAQLLEIDYKELEIGEGISQGGFSIVHKGYYRDTPVAIKKIFNPKITSELMEEMSNEVDMLNRLRHPNIVLLMGVCSKPPNLCIVTEHAEKGSLFSLLHSINKKTDIKPDLKLDIAREIALAINYLHLSKIVHRDIKSHNVLLDSKYKVKLCDFGLARHTDALNKGSMQFSGTPTYMAPEIFQKRAYDEKIDVFAFGTLLWELFARKVPFEGLEPADIMQKVMKEDQLNTVGIPKKIAQLVTDCRQMDPKKRPGFSSILSTLNSITSL